MGNVTLLSDSKPATRQAKLSCAPIPVGRVKRAEIRRYMLLAGIFMAAAGAYLIFTRPQMLPLWFIWLVGAFLWYVGIAFSIAGTAFMLFVPHVRISPTRSLADGVSVPPDIAPRDVSIDLLLKQIEKHVRLEQAAAEWFLAFPTPAHLHSNRISRHLN